MKAGALVRVFENSRFIKTYTYPARRILRAVNHARGGA